MRVLLVTNGLRYGGAERIVEALAIDLAARGLPVAVAATTRDGPIGETLRKAGLPVRILRIQSKYDLRVPLRLARFAREFEASVIHSHLAVSDIAVAMATPLLQGARRISTAHNAGVELSWKKRSAWIAALHGFDRVLAVSQGVARALEARSPLLHPLVTHPSLVEITRPSLSRAEARARLGVPEGARLILGIGRLAPVKGFDLLAEAAGLLPSGLRVMLIGEGPDRDRLSGGRLELAGGREDAALLYPAADVVVCPSRSEGFPQVPLEAMAAGVPVIATDVAGLSELVIDDQTGVLVPPEDPRALAAAIQDLLADPRRAARICLAARERLSQAGLTREAMVETVLASYRGASRP